MLRKCCPCLCEPDDTEGVDVKLNCIINSACCAEGRIKDVEVIEGQDVCAQQQQPSPKSIDGKDSGEEVDEEGGEHVEKIVLQSESSRRSCIGESLSYCSELADSESEGMANETGDLHSTQNC